MLIDVAAIDVYFQMTMAKKPINIAKTSVYRLIEAGFLSRQALLTPLQQCGLEPGDDAILLALKEDVQPTDADLMTRTGLPLAALSERLRRLQSQRMVRRLSVEVDGICATRLTDIGNQTCLLLSEHWQQLEEALVGELKPKDRKKLNRILQRFVALLDLQDSAA